MPRPGPEKLERRRKKLLNLVIEKDFNLTEVAKAKGVSHQAVSQAVDRYGIREEYTRIAEELGMGTKAAIKELIETHIKKNQDRQALTYHLDQLTSGGKEGSQPNLNIKNINVITSEAYKQAKEKFEGKGKEVFAAEESLAGKDNEIIEAK